MALIEQSAVGNYLITSLPQEGFDALHPYLQRVDLSLRATLHKSGELISAVFFPEQGYVSMLAALEDGDSSEVGLIGYEGMVGVPVILGTDRSPVEAFVQGEGTALRLDAAVLRQAMDENRPLRALLLRYAMAFSMQVTMTAACNSRHLIEQRLARWLLMAHDRFVGDEFPMTHEFMSLMLGVRRAGVTVAAGSLQRAGYIHYEQGRIRIADRPGLESAACECYGIVKREFDRLLGAAPKR